MKNITKIWLLSLVLAAAYSFVTLSNVNAAETTTVTITAWNSACDQIADYDFGTHPVQLASHTTGASNTFSCELWRSILEDVDLAFSDMTASGLPTIDSWNLVWATTNVTHNGTILPTDQTGLTSASKIYDEVAGHEPYIGELSGSLDMTLTIPANQPAGTYNGTITVTVSA